MKNLKLRLTSLLLILILLSSSLIPTLAVESNALLIYSDECNSGTRDVVCTTLDGTSAASYYANYQYDNLSQLSSQALLSTLRTLMQSTHSYVSSYDDCHYKADQTDCEGENGKVILLYTSYEATMSQWNGWNREHVWPQSLGGGNTSGGGADLHHVRPSDAGVNSSRGNKKYGESGSNPSSKYGSNPAVGYLGGTYNSNYFEPNDNVKGDVARICLYVYVRWGSAWGAESITEVFQSIEILLEWCALDPVDTWEMGRNEVVEAIQGNRNVFIDYPEYAWLLFGKEVPSDLVTPSGKASGGTASGGSSGSGTTNPDVGGSTNPDPSLPSGSSAALSFASKDQRVSQTSAMQIWEQNGITFTNKKASSGNDVADYAAPVRLYQGSSIQIESQNKITKIEFQCNSSDYATALKNSIGSAASVSGNTVTVTLQTPATSYTVESLSAQVRLNGLTVFYEEENEPTGCDHENRIATSTHATCSTAGITTVVCHDCGVTVSSAATDPAGHLFVDLVCVRCGYIEPKVSESTSGGWTLVNNASELKAGDKIVLVSGEFVAGDIGNSIMASVSGVSVSGNTIASLPSGAVILTLGGSAGAWTLTNAQGQKLGATAVKKLSWTSGTNTWSISISNGSATVQNTNSSYGRFLYNVNAPRFTTYTSDTTAAMLLPRIYKFVEGSASEEETTIEAASMIPGTTLAISYYVSGYDKNASYYMVFTMNETRSERITGVEQNGYLVFRFEGVAPQHMGDLITAELYCSGSDTPVSTMKDYSVCLFAERAITAHSDRERLINLLADMLRYGAAAQIYQNYRTDRLVTDLFSVNGFDLGDWGSNATHTEEDNAREVVTEEGISKTEGSFTAVGLRFDYYNQIFIKFKAEDVSKIQIAINDSLVEDLNDRLVSLGGGVYALYTDGMTATEFDEIYTFELYVNGSLRQMMTYSANSYVYAKGGDLTEQDESNLSAMAALVRALYRYGQSAEAYIG